MVLTVLRGLFVLMMTSAGWYLVGGQAADWITFFKVLGILAGATLIVCFDIIAPRKKLALFSGTILGIVVGMIMTYALHFLVVMLLDRFFPNYSNNENFSKSIDVILGLTCCYLSISFIFQTRDDFRFIVPYVEFSKQTRGARPMLLDTSVLIDGRIADIAETGIMESRLIVPRFVLEELQQIADSADKLKRNRGRRGLDVMARLQANRRTEVILYDSSHRTSDATEEVDAKLMNLATELNSRVLTNDFNLNKVASLRGVDVINVNDLANALKPVVLPGEKMKVRMQKSGESPGQGVGYLEDGTMVVVEQGRQHLNEEVEFTVTSVLQTSAGKMIFGRMAHET